MTVTATESLLKIQQDARDNEGLNLMIRHFIKQWEPEDRRDRLDFEMRLHEIIRATYWEAAKPYKEIMSAGMTSLHVDAMFNPKAPK